MSRSAIALSLLLLSGTDVALPRTVSLAAILSNGPAFDGKPLVVSGYLCKQQSSESAMFLTSEDCRIGNYHNAVKLTGYRIRIDKFEGLLIVRGTFVDWSETLKVDENVTAGEIRVQSILEMRKPRR